MTVVVSGETTLLLLAAALAGWPSGPLLIGARSRAPTGAPDRPRLRRGMVAALGVSAAALLVGVDWWWALPSGALVGVVVGRHPGSRRLSPAALLELAEHADLWAACLDAGLTVGGALAAVADVSAEAGSAGPSARGQAARVPLDALTAVAAMLALGADADVAWRPADTRPELAALASAARRAAGGGVPLAAAVREHATTLRERVDTHREQASGRAGVALAAPLGLCFLPAFICLGLAPVVIGLLGALGIGGP